MDISAKLVIILLLLVPFVSLAQYHYNIDVEPLKKRRLNVSEFIIKSKSNFKVAKELQKRKRIETKISKETKRHTYNNQTRVVRKRMKKTEKNAKHYNNRTIPLRIRFKKLVYG